MTRTRTATTVIAARPFPITIAADDKHDWQLADPSDQPEFDRRWAQMEAGLRDRQRGAA